MSKSNKITQSEGHIDLAAIVKTWPRRVRATGMKQEDVSRETKVGAGSLSAYLNGITSPNIRNFEKIENFLRGKGV